MSTVDIDPASSGARLGAPGEADHLTPTPPTTPTAAVRATTGRQRVLVVGIAGLALCSLWGIRHAHSFVVEPGAAHPFLLAYLLAFALLVWQLTLSSLEKPYVASSPAQRDYLDGLDVVVSVPAYNEDPDLLRSCLASLLDQTRRPKRIYVVDDGTDKVDLGEYEVIEKWLRDEAFDAGVDVVWQRQINAGKRHAQGACIAGSPGADIVVTVDSDSILDPHAIEQILLPFADLSVNSVGGVVLTANNTRNLLTRMTDLWFVCGQLVDRSALSTMRSVLVNSGSLAAYRAHILRANLDAYLNERFFGHAVQFGDDSMLPLYGLATGRSVQQPTAFSFAAMPETVSHHLRQYLRWMRGSFIRSFWRFRYLPVTGYAYWRHFAGWVQWALSTAIVVRLFLYRPVAYGDWTTALAVVGVPLALEYARALRYLTVRRADESFRSQLLTWSLAPLMSLWAFTTLRLVRLYAMATCTRTGWGTRQHGAEVTLAPAPDPAS
jgi:hyaluronan synthase